MTLAEYPATNRATIVRYKMTGLIELLIQLLMNPPCIKPLQSNIPIPAHHILLLCQQLMMHELTYHQLHNVSTSIVSPLSLWTQLPGIQLYSMKLLQTIINICGIRILPYITIISTSLLHLLNNNVIHKHTMCYQSDDVLIAVYQCIIVCINQFDAVSLMSQLITPLLQTLKQHILLPVYALRYQHQLNKSSVADDINDSIQHNKSRKKHKRNNNADDQVITDPAVVQYFDTHIALSVNALQCLLHILKYSTNQLSVPEFSDIMHILITIALSLTTQHGITLFNISDDYKLHILQCLQCITKSAVNYNYHVTPDVIQLITMTRQHNKSHNTQFDDIYMELCRNAQCNTSINTTQTATAVLNKQINHSLQSLSFTLPDNLFDQSIHHKHAHSTTHTARTDEVTASTALPSSDTSLPVSAFIVSDAIDNYCANSRTKPQHCSNNQVQQPTLSLANTVLRSTSTEISVDDSVPVSLPIVSSTTTTATAQPLIHLTPHNTNQPNNIIDEYTVGDVDDINDDEPDPDDQTPLWNIQ